MKTTLVIGILFLLLFIIRKKRKGRIPYYRYGWGELFLDSLSLSKKERRILNYISHSYQSHRLYNISFYREELVKLYLSFLRKSTEDKFSLAMYLELFYYCDSLLRTKYMCFFFSDDRLEQLDSQTQEIYKQRINELSVSIRPLDEEMNVILFKEDSSRWERFYRAMIEEFSGADIFYDNIIHLSSLLTTITSNRNLFYKSYRFAVHKSAIVSLKLYLHYLNIGSESSSFKHLNISQSNQKILFANASQKDQFFKLVKNFKESSNLEEALESIDILFRRRRKKIILNENEIQTAREDLNEVVMLLSEYLEDGNSIPENLVSFDTASNRSTLDDEFIQLFVNNQFRLRHSDVDRFVTEKGVFRSQLIDRLNEDNYEFLDDLLIEEDSEGYSLNEDYYIKIGEL